MADSGGESAQGHHRLISSEQLCDQHDKSDLQKIQSHSREACFFAQYPAGVAAAQVSASILSDICLVEAFADHQGKGN